MGRIGAAVTFPARPVMHAPAALRGGGVGVDAAGGGLTPRKSLARPARILILFPNDGRCP